MPTILRGTRSPLQQYFEQQFDPSTGFTFRQEFHGNDLTAMSELSNYYTQLGVSATLRFQAGASVLTLVDATGNVVVDKWEITVEEEQPSVFENVILLETINPAANRSQLLTRLRNALQNGDSLNSEWDTLIADPKFIAAAQGVDLDKLKQYFDDYNLGNTNFLRDKYRLRHTTNAPNRWQTNIADFNVSMAYTISQLLSESQNVTLWALPLPGYLVFKILNYVPPPPSLRSNFTYGALKTASSATTAANNRVDITTEYIIDWINTNLYPFI